MMNNLACDLARCNFEPFFNVPHVDVGIVMRAYRDNYIRV